MKKKKGEKAVSKNQGMRGGTHLEETICGYEKVCTGVWANELRRI